MIFRTYVCQPLVIAPILNILHVRFLYVGSSAEVQAYSWKRDLVVVNDKTLTETFGYRFIWAKSKFGEEKVYRMYAAVRQPTFGTERRQPISWRRHLRIF